MADALELDLKLGTAECLRGESVPFRLTLRNPGTREVNEVRTFDPWNAATFLRARPVRDGGTAAGASPRPGEEEGVRGCGLTAFLRDGFFAEPPDRPERRTLDPGAELTLTGDLLEWLGELPPGRWELRADHLTTGSRAVSPPVPLRVRPASPVTLATARPGLRGATAPHTGAFVHAGEKERLVFYQVQSVHLPKNPLRAVRVGRSKGRTQVAAATLAAEGIEKGHVLWLYGRDLALAVVDLPGRVPPRVVPVKGPAVENLLESPLGMPDGSVFAPVADGRFSRVSVLEIRPDGSARSHPLDLGGKSPVAAYSCCWESTAKLHFAWVGPGARVVSTTSLFLDEPGLGSFEGTPVMFDDPVLAVQAHLERRPLGGGVGEEDETEPPPPRLAIWAVCRHGDELRLVRAHPDRPRPGILARFDVKDRGEVRVLSTVVSAEDLLCVLYAGEDGTVWTASAASRTTAPLEDEAGRPVVLNQQPGLMAAGPLGTLPWVYARYIDGREGRIAWRLVEPAGEADPEYPRLPF